MSHTPRLSFRVIGFAALVALSVAAVAVIARTRAGGPELVSWSEDLASAKHAAGGKFLLLDFTAGWCPACQEMRRTTWTDDGVAADIAARCVPVKVDVDAHPDFGREYHVEYLPTLVLTDADGHELRRSVGYLATDEFRRWLDGRS